MLDHLLTSENIMQYRAECDGALELLALCFILS